MHELQVVVHWNKYQLSWLYKAGLDLNLYFICRITFSFFTIWSGWKHTDCLKSIKCFIFKIYLANDPIKWNTFRNKAFSRTFQSLSITKIDQYFPVSQLWVPHFINTPEIHSKSDMILWINSYFSIWKHSLYFHLKYTISE